MAAMDRLSAAAIALPGVEVRLVESCGSTNSELLEDKQLTMPVLLATEIQTAGRGRRGRRWHSRPGGSITFSLARRIARPARELAALSLVAGVAAASALRALGVKQASLKWPNDLLADGAKLGGILVETRMTGGAALAVVGIGINYLPAPELARRLRRRVACISELVSELPSRNEIIRKTAAALVAALESFERGGFAAVREAWLALDAHAGQRLRVRLADGRTVSGVAAGLAEDGGLQLRTRAGIRAIHSGRVVSSRALA
jgi:BirA family biotin operon repressor/biotin-[acetyl-CoA-carboxylase] ligase